jgi:hypothetical protein
MLNPAESGGITPELSRPNTKIALIVEAGIRLKDQLSITDAAEFLQKNGVSFNVIVRTLAEPSLRRQRD